jgi:hypothetical protein
MSNLYRNRARQHCRLPKRPTRRIPIVRRPARKVKHDFVFFPDLWRTRSSSARSFPGRCKKPRLFSELLKTWGSTSTQRAKPSHFIQSSTCSYPTNGARASSQGPG